MDALAFLELKQPPQVLPVYVLAGDQDFLKRQARRKILTLVLGEADDAFGRSVYEGDAVEWATVRDELDTLPFASPMRLVEVRGADPFVSANRARLEKYVEKPSKVGVLVLEVSKWPSNTRLAKTLAGPATLECDAPRNVAGWCVQWAAAGHGKKLTSGAAQLLVDLAGKSLNDGKGDDLGLLDQEIGKLAAYVGDGATINEEAVDKMVGQSRVKNTFQMLDAAAEGRGGEALALLHQLFEQGDDPFKVLGGISWQLRPMAQAARLIRGGVSLGDALSRVKIPPFARGRVQEWLRRLGPRALELYDWLLETDLALKSSGALPPHLLIERLVVRLSGGR
jgi:DNA polymerase-3 subunit delta